MRKRFSFTLILTLTVGGLSFPDRVAAQDDLMPSRPLSKAIINVPVPPSQTAVSFQNDGRRGDSLANGMLIGAGIGAAIGMLVLPQTMCGGHDTECATIVRAAVGLPVIAGGIGIGALVDGLHKQRARPAGVTFNVTW